MNRNFALTGLLILAFGLACCGKVGQLERPGPMFGKATAEDGKAEKPPEQEPSRPLQTVDPRDRSADTAPPRP